jgi:hypothetical protein
VLSVSANACDDRSSGHFVRVMVVTSGHGKARAQTFKIPLPRRRQGLVEIVHLEDEVAFRGREHAEIQEMTIPARLHPEARNGCGRQVIRHQPRGAAQERERTAQHAAIADGDQLGHSIPIGFLKHVDGITALGRRFPGGVILARHLLP